MQFTGRVDRRTYIVAQVVLYPIAYVVFGLFFLAVRTIDSDFTLKDVPQVLRGTTLSPSVANVVAVVTGIAAIAIVVAFLSYTVRRLHDLEFSGWFIVLWPLLNVVIGPSDDPQGFTAAAVQVAFEAVLMMVPGILGSNEYGADPRATLAPTG